MLFFKFYPTPIRPLCERSLLTKITFPVSLTVTFILASPTPLRPVQTPGVKEHALFLKELGDASNLRDRMLDAFETAALQDDPVEKTKLCTFVVVGAGPTGVEVSLRDGHRGGALAATLSLLTHPLPTPPSLPH